MTDQITPEALAEALAEARELAKKHGDAAYDGRRLWTFEMDEYGIAALIAHIRAAATAAERERCEKIAERLKNDWHQHDGKYACEAVADEIRRGR